ncbi:MAG: thioredoxin [Pseudoflavonifractor sp.]|nr:thioredoxin [Alloprevotella sp.]MCM1116305.1 thioredoxin [Pseudoflavonifractor sp.]
MNEFDKFIADSKPTLVDFFATWCGPCKMQAPILEEVKNKLGDKVNIIKIDVDRNPELSSRYNVRSIPTLIVFKNGEALWRGYGLHQADQLEAKINEFL